MPPPIRSEEAIHRRGRKKEKSILILIYVRIMREEDVDIQ